MTPGTFNLALYRGDSYKWRVELWQDAAQTIPVDLTGVVPAAEIRERTAGVRIVELLCTPEPPNAVIVEMTPDMYVAVPANGVWDLQLTFPDGAVHTPVAGTVTVTGDVTDSEPLARQR